jgi:hypothetical protein
MSAVESVPDVIGEAVGLNLGKRKIKKVRQNKQVNLVRDFNTNTQQ